MEVFKIQVQRYKCKDTSAKIFNKKYSLFIRCSVLSLLITILGIPFGEKLAGRFAVSNVCQILGFLVLLPEILRNITRKFLAWFFFLPSSMFLSMFVLSLYYKNEFLVKLPHVAFFTLMLTYVGYFVIMLNRNVNIRENIEFAYKITIIPAFIYLSILGIGNAISGVTVSRFGFDDKSHAVFFCAFYAFLALKYMKGDYKLIVSIIFMVLSLMTASRLVVPFLPFYLFILCKHAFKSKNMAYKIFITSILILIITFLAVNANFFYVYSRVTTDNSAGSTREHLDLIRSTLQMKFENVFNLILGTGPGNFGDLFQYTDIKSYMQKTHSSSRGTIPAHSSHAQIFLEFSIVVFIAYLWFLYRIFIGNWKNKNILELCFYIPFISAVVFYSTHNEVLYWMILLYLYAESMPDSRKIMS